MEYIKATKTELNILNARYIKNLTAPLDDFWEEAVFPNCDYYLIKDKSVKGFYSLDSNKSINQFYLSNKDDYFSVLSKLIRDLNIKKAFASTYDPLFFDACLKLSSSKTSHTYLYTEDSVQKTTLDIDFEVANIQDLERAVTYNKSLGDGDWVRDYYKKLIPKKGLLLFTKDNIIIGTGEMRLSKSFDHYINIGVTVSKDYRRKGVASYIVNKVKSLANLQGYKTVCSTTYDNIASQKTLTKCGYKHYHTIYEITFN